MDAKKFLGDDPAAQGKGMSDALLHRLMVQVQSYSIEGENGEDINPEEIIAKMKQNGGNPGSVEDIYKMTHIVHVRQLDNENDPNTATDILQYTKGEAWKSLVEKEASKMV